MQKETLFDNLVKRANKDFSFHSVKMTHSQREDKIEIARAKRLEEEGYVEYSVCDLSDGLVRLKGRFTEKGILRINNELLHA